MDRHCEILVLVLFPQIRNLQSHSYDFLNKVVEAKEQLIMFLYCISPWSFSYDSAGTKNRCLSRQRRTVHLRRLWIELLV